MDLSETPAVVVRRHPWEVARRDFFLWRLRSLGLHRRPIDVLDVGSGDAWLATTMLPALDSGTRITCWDSAYSAAHLEDLARQAGPRARFVTTRPRERFDVVLLLDVLEHVEDDAAFLGEVVAHNVRDGGHVLVSVPAWRALFGDHDVRLRHFRRYQPHEAARLLEGAGLAILHHGGLFHSLVLPRVVERLASGVGLLKAPPPNAGEWRAGPVLTAVVERALTWDGWLSVLLSRGRLALPGLSWWAICVKRSS